MEEILVLGNGGHARSLIDILERQGKYKIKGYIVNDNITENAMDYHVIGTDDDLGKLYKSGIRNAAVGIGYLGKSHIREILYTKLKNIGFYLPIICDPSAIVSKHASIGEGSFIGKGSIINAGAVIGKMCIINTGAIVEHDCIVGDFSHISVSSILCGEVKVGEAAFVGAGATVIQGKSIGDKCIIGAGTTIRKNVNSNYMTRNKEAVMSLPMI